MPPCFLWIVLRQNQNGTHACYSSHFASQFLVVIVSAKLFLLEGNLPFSEFLLV
jgi:hypothetical protein